MILLDMSEEDFCDEFCMWSRCGACQHNDLPKDFPRHPSCRFIAEIPEKPTNKDVLFTMFPTSASLKYDPSHPIETMEWGNKPYKLPERRD